MLSEISQKLSEISPKLAKLAQIYQKISKLTNVNIATKYTDHSSLCKHIKYTCKKNKDEDFQELARLLNEKDKQIALKDKKTNGYAACVER